MFSKIKHTHVKILFHHIKAQFMRKITPFLILYFVLIFSSSIQSQTYIPGNSGMFTFDQLMGVNTLRDDPVEPMNCVGYINSCGERQCTNYPSRQFVPIDF